MTSIRTLVTSTTAAVTLTLAAVVALARDDHGGMQSIDERPRDASGVEARASAMPALDWSAYGVVAQAVVPGSQPPGAVPSTGPGVPGAPTVAQPPPMREPPRPGVDERPLSSRVYGHDPERDRRSNQYRSPLQSAPLPGETR